MREGEREESEERERRGGRERGRGRRRGGGRGRDRERRMPHRHITDCSVCIEKLRSTDIGHDT